MTRIRNIDPLNFSMAVDSGCILEEVKRVAEEHDCFFLLSLGAQGSCQIGGNIATIRAYPAANGRFIYFLFDPSRSWQG